MTSTTRLTCRGTGLLLVGIAAWGGIVAFVGPTFDFTMANTTSSWVWNESHATMHFAPGLVGVVGGLLLLTAPRAAIARLGALLAVVSGTWFVIGPTLEPLWHRGGVNTSGTIGSTGSTTMRALEGIGYHYGTGAAMVLLSAFAFGVLALVPVMSTGAAPATEPRTTEQLPRPQRFSRHHATHA